MKDPKQASVAWAAYYKDRPQWENIFPESFMARIFLSRSPIRYLDQDFEDKMLLDLGCGHGRHIPFLDGLGFNVSGLEVAQEQVESLTNRFPEQQFLCGSSAHIPTPDQSYDIVTACNSLYYIDDINEGFEAHLNEVARVLKDVGILVFSMVGAQHSILKNCEKQGDYARLKYDFLGFREDTLIRPLWDKAELNALLKPHFDLQKSGEIIETSEGFVRHIHYMVAYKKTA